MTWRLETADDRWIELRRDDGLRLSAAVEYELESRTVWTFTVQDESSTVLTSHGWEIRTEEHLWEVLDCFTHRFGRARTTRVE